MPAGHAPSAARSTRSPVAHSRNPNCRASAHVVVVAADQHHKVGRRQSRAIAVLSSFSGISVAPALPGPEMSACPPSHAIRCLGGRCCWQARPDIGRAGDRDAYTASSGAAYSTPSRGCRVRREKSDASLSVVALSRCCAFYKRRIAVDGPAGAWRWVQAIQTARSTPACPSNSTTRMFAVAGHRRSPC